MLLNVLLPCQKIRTYKNRKKFEVHICIVRCFEVYLSMNFFRLLSQLSSLGCRLEADWVNSNPETGILKAMRSLQNRLISGEDENRLMEAATVLADVELLLLAERN